MATSPSTGFIPQHRDRWLWIIVLAVVIAVVVGILYSRPAAPAVPAPAPAPVALVADGWKATDIHLRDNHGLYTVVTARVTNLEQATRGSVFTIVLLRNGQVVTGAHGSVSGVAPGATVTAQLGSPKVGINPAGLEFELQPNQ